MMPPLLSYATPHTDARTHLTVTAKYMKRNVDKYKDTKGHKEKQIMT